MANPEHLKILRQGVEVWNKWRDENPEIEPDLSRAELSSADLREFNFFNTNLMRTNLQKANLDNSNFLQANLGGANLKEANLRRSNLKNAFLLETDFELANLEGTNFEDSFLSHAIFNRANLKGANFKNASLGISTFEKANLENANLENANLEEANLIGANLKGVDLRNANLQKAQIEGANLRKEDLEGTLFYKYNDKINNKKPYKPKPSGPPPMSERRHHKSQADETKQKKDLEQARYNNQEWDEIKDSSEKLEDLIELEKNEKGINWTKIIQEEIEKLPTGQVLFNVPTSMKTGQKERIEVRISQDLNEDIAKNLKGRGIPEIEISKVGNFMKVKLSGDPFKIIPLNEEEQIVAEDTFTEWAWDVVPLKSKTQVLHFHVTIRLKIEGSEEKRDYPVIDKEVDVKVNPIYSTKVFAVNNWKWILMSLIIPLAGWILRMVLVRGK